MLAALIVASTDERLGFCSSAWIVPLTSVNRPFTVVIIMCLAENSTSVCAGSSSQVVSVSAVLGAVAMYPPRSDCDADDSVICVIKERDERIVPGAMRAIDDPAPPTSGCGAAWGPPWRTHRRAAEPASARRLDACASAHYLQT